MAQTRSIFVGNIPYDATEEQLKEVFKVVGPVVSFRLVVDRETGKPKGFGFCEYRDAETAHNAMHNLNGYELNGRSLRVDFAENEKSAGGAPEKRGRTGGKRDRNPLLPTPAAFPPGIFPSPIMGTVGAPTGPALTAEQQISNVLETMTTHQLYEIMAQIKGMTDQSPEQARQLLMSNPQFAFALLQAQVILGMVDPRVVQQLLQGTIPPSGSTPSAMSIPSNFPPAPQPPSQGPPHLGVPPQAFPVNAPTPQPQMFVPPQHSQQLLQQVLQLTPQQIDNLPPVQRAQVKQLQEQLKSQLGSHF